jgi:uncharacterized repeat protein (TIGR03803 family)
MRPLISVLLAGSCIAQATMAAGPDVIAPIHIPGRGEGWEVADGIAQDGQGNLYGLVRNSNGGVFVDKVSRGCGMVFRINAKGMRTTLYDFSSHSLSHGCGVYGRLVIHDGVLYGVTGSGGRDRHGTVYRLSADGGHQLLHRFNGADGSLPGDGLALASDGALYGVTSGGGAHGAGTVFRITASGQFESLYSFEPFDPVGSRPNWRLTVGPDGALYGVAYGGGDTVYRVGLDGVVSLVKRFRYGEGCRPQALTLGSDGWLYGAAFICGPHDMGTLYRVLPSGAFERLHAFSGPDVGMPKDQLTEGPDGTWYGIATGDLGNPPKTIYKIRFDGSAPVPLHNFDDSQWRGAPSGPLLLAQDGLLYSTSSGGGNTKGLEGIGSGMVFRLAP